jgi:hypothetical protein
MAGINPAYIARQLGHANARMLFTTYAKWIDAADRGRQKAKMEEMLRVTASAAAPVSGDVLEQMKPKPSRQFQKIVLGN